MTRILIIAGLLVGALLYWLSASNADALAKCEAAGVQSTETCIKYTN